MKVVRDSKFRHVHGEALKTKYEDLRLSSKSTESAGIRVNPKFFAFPWESGGGGTLAVIPNTRYGRMPRDIPLLTGHTGGILDFEFSPFDDNMLLSCSEDMKLMLWQIPDEGLKQHLKEPLAVIEGHQKKVSFSTFNPTAGNIAASAAFDLTVRTWNLAEQEEVFKVETPEQVTHLKWNYMGSLLAATCKDKTLRLIDPRTNQLVSGCKIHDGVKASKVEWIGSSSATDECYKLVTTGFSSSAQRQMTLWDTRMFSSAADQIESLTSLDLDQGTGALFPFFDHGTQMLFVAGKGDGNVRFFEMTPEAPFFHYIDDFRTTAPQKGFALMPKRCVDVMKHEIMRGYKLESSAVVPVTFRVPRKSEIFQEDLYPDCPSLAPAMTADDWVAGAEAKMPRTRSMQPDAAAEDAGKPLTASITGVVTLKDLKKTLSERDAELAEAKAKIQALEKENGALKEELSKLKA